MHSLVCGGADIIELGVPFTDPEADGPSIQLSSERALRQQVTLNSVCAMVREFRETNKTTPVVLMGYLNPILAIGLENAANKFVESGVDGLIVVNLPPEESTEMSAVLSPRGIDLIYLIAPTTERARIEYIAAKGSGFLYYVSIKGITGADHLDPSNVERHLAQIRECTELPIAVGFGIKTPDAAASIAKFADGVVVGSRLVDIMGSELEQSELMSSLTNEVKTLADGVRGITARS